ncbi:hypothetical protein ABZV91_08525 [Nocardia sp. NPDC004568]|uniref:hypothetical protein n=1 Tax=Nocardia sp. NPDC004568 TaxID=3154551 RepID=UPI0033B170FF
MAHEHDRTEAYKTEDRTGTTERAEAGRAEVSGMGEADRSVPGWCAFFTPDEYVRFAQEVDEAAGCFGADGQNIAAGHVTLAAGAPEPELHEFDLTELAGRCRASDIDEWPSLCFVAIDEFSTAQPQRDWLTLASFAEVEELLEPWLAAEPELMFEAEPDAADQPFSTPLEDGRYLHLLAAVPDFDDMPEITTFVPNSAVQAWGLSAEKLVRWASPHL